MRSSASRLKSAQGQHGVGRGMVVTAQGSTVTSTPVPSYFVPAGQGIQRLCRTPLMRRRPHANVAIWCNASIMPKGGLA